MANRSAYRFVEGKGYQPTEKLPADVKLPTAASPIVPVENNSGGGKDAAKDADDSNDGADRG